jgi:SAM-dependent methyltransferase
VTFVRAGAEDLSPLADGSVDAVTTRSVIIYVKPKRQAFEEFFRVLGSGGRLSTFEPINRFNQPLSASVSYEGFDMTPVLDIYRRIRDFYAALQPPDSDPMLDFDERDLIQFADAAGFRSIALEYHAEIGPPKEQRTWERAIRGAWNPKVPTLEEAMQRLLTSDEIDHYTNYLRPLIESDAGRSRNAYAFLSATK